MGQTAIPNKYEELIGLGVASLIQRHFCIHFHTEDAKLWGATAAEISDALMMAKLTAGWSTYVAGSQHGLAKFKHEIAKLPEYITNRKLYQKAA